MNIQYAVLDDDPDAKTKFSTTTHWEQVPDHDWAVTDCAEDYVANHDGWDGWDSGQSRAFALFTESGEPLGVFDVTVEFTPIYHATLRASEEKS